MKSTKKKVDLSKPMTDAEFFSLSADELSQLGERLSKAPAIAPDPKSEGRLKRALKGPTVRRGPGRPRIGQGAAKVLISVEKSLLAKADQYAKSHNLGRSELIARALAQVINKAG